MTAPTRLAATISLRDAADVLDQTFHDEASATPITWTADLAVIGKVQRIVGWQFRNGRAVVAAAHPEPLLRHEATGRLWAPTKDGDRHLINRTEAAALMGKPLHDVMETSAVDYADRLHVSL